jgi:hypothetical protein
MKNLWYAGFLLCCACAHKNEVYFYSANRSNGFESVVFKCRLDDSIVFIDTSDYTARRPDQSFIKKIDLDSGVHTFVVETYYTDSLIGIATKQLPVNSNRNVYIIFSDTTSISMSDQLQEFQ